MKILLAIDGSSYTKQMLAYLVENKELFANAAQDYTVMTVIAPLPTRVNTALSKEVILKYYADESDKITEPVDELAVSLTKPVRNYGNESNYRYGVKEGHARVAALLDKYDVTSTWTAAALAL